MKSESIIAGSSDFKSCSTGIKFVSFGDYTLQEIYAHLTRFDCATACFVPSSYKIINKL